MARKNLFVGTGTFPQLAKRAYDRLMTGEWVTYHDVVAGEWDIDEHTKDSRYGELKKVFMELRRAICERVGEDSIMREGNNRSRRYRYMGADRDPLADMLTAKTISSLRQYWQFCQDSEGFFPMSWLEYFFRDSRDLLEIKRRRRSGKQVMSASLDRRLDNIDLLPQLYEAIVKQTVLRIIYKPYEKEIQELVFHPHFLKEYNGRWFLLGHSEGYDKPTYGYNIALDRIVKKPVPLWGRTFLAPPEQFYQDYFKKLVGVTHKDGNIPVSVRMRASTFYIFKLLETKPLHESQQTTVEYGNHADGTYGEFTLLVELNEELEARILQMGYGLEVKEPIELREKLRDDIRRMMLLYEE